LKFMET